jgi:hypothetical protein
MGDPLGFFGTLILLQKLMGTVEPTLFVRAAVVCGIMVGIASASGEPGGQRTDRHGTRVCRISAGG